jgi:hypothetical protein
MEILAWLVIFGPFLFVGASFTGGFAGAIAGGGREDRSILDNAGIGFVGWLAAWATMAAVKGSPPEELTLAHIGLAVIWSIVFIRLVLDRERHPRVGVRGDRHL